MSSLQLSELEAITGAKDLKTFDLGESIKKYVGIYRGEKVLFRVYPKDDYYSNRFLRAGAALRALTKTINKFNKSNPNYSLIIPKIIEEWPDTTLKSSIRALTWVKGAPIEPNKNPFESAYIMNLVNLFLETGKYMPANFSFETDFLAHFQRPFATNQRDNSQWKVFIQLITKLLEGINHRLYEEKALIHGDLHYGNILKFQEAGEAQKPHYAIIDWEFATRGSIYFDLAYLYIFSGWTPPPTIINEIEAWKGLAIAAITHWYLINTPNSIHIHFWLGKLMKYFEGLP